MLLVLHHDSVNTSAVECACRIGNRIACHPEGHLDLAFSQRHRIVRLRLAANSHIVPAAVREPVHVL